MMHAIVYGHIVDIFNNDNDKDDLRSATKEGTRKKASDDSNRETISSCQGRKKRNVIYIYIYLCF